MEILKIGEIEIPYSFRRSKKARRVIVRVNDWGAEVVLPLGVSARYGEKFLFSKKEWLAKSFSKISSNKGKFFFLGKEVFPRFEAGNLVLEETENKKEFSEELKSAFEDFLFVKAREYIPKRVHELAFLYGFEIGKIRIKKLKSRWGSCTLKKNFSFNYALMKYSPRAIDYVIIHELCHTKIMNHSKDFWNLVASIMPEYKEARKELKEKR